MLVACVMLARFPIACERARLPHLCGEPIALTKGQTVWAMSDEAAHFGVTLGQTASGARALCPNVIIMRYDSAAYEAAACPVWDVLASYSDVVEPISSELAFFALSKIHAERDATRLAISLARAIGIPVHIGVGRSKIVAEQAARASSGDKGSAPLFINVGDEAALLASLPLALVTEMPRGVIGRVRIDKRLLLRLERLGVRTLGDSLALPAQNLPRSLRNISQLLRDLAYGIDRNSICPKWPPKTISAEEKFDEYVENAHSIHTVLGCLAEQIGDTLSAKSEYARTLLLQVEFADKNRAEQRDRFVVPIACAADLRRHAVRLFSKLVIRQPVAALLLVAGDIGSGSGAQLALPALADARQIPLEIRRLRLDATLDFLRREFGLSAVLTGQQMLASHSRRAILYGALPFGHITSAPIQVAIDHTGQPVRYWQRSRGQRDFRCHEVRRAVARWRESKWQADLSVIDREVWRVETDACGVSELSRIGAEWRLTAYAD